MVFDIHLTQLKPKCVCSCPKYPGLFHVNGVVSVVRRDPQFQHHACCDRYRTRDLALPDLAFPMREIQQRSLPDESLVGIEERPLDGQRDGGLCALSEAIVSSFPETGAVKAWLSKSSPPRAQPPSHNEVLLRGLAENHFSSFQGGCDPILRGRRFLLLALNLNKGAAISTMST